MVDQVKSSIKDKELLSKRRTALCNAAAKLFRKNGFHKTTLPKIAEESGMSVGSIYRYIKRKEDLLILMMDRIRILLETTVYPIANEQSLPEKKLFSAIKGYYTLIDENADYFHIALRDMKFINEFRDVLHQRESNTVNCFTSILREGISKGSFAEVPVDLFAYDIVIFGHTWISRSYQFQKLTINQYIQIQFEIIKRVLKVETDLSNIEAGI